MRGGGGDSRSSSIPFACFFFFSSLPPLSPFLFLWALHAENSISTMKMREKIVLHTDESNPLWHPTPAPVRTRASEREAVQVCERARRVLPWLEITVLWFADCAAPAPVGWLANKNNGKWQRRRLGAQSDTPLPFPPLSFSLSLGFCHPISFPPAAIFLPTQI